MTKKQTVPIITHTEILCRAIASLDAEIRRWEDNISGHPELSYEINCMIEPLQKKRNALLQMYEIETGVEYTI